MSKLLKSKIFLGAVVAAGLALAGTAGAAYMHTTTLKMGSTGLQVTSLQTTLNMTSCKVGASLATGYFGALTKAAVMCFQAANSLVADGVVGPMTGAALGGIMSGNFPAGCTSAAGYSTVTGLPCTSGPSTGLPAGCSSTAGYSPTTGAKCDGSTSGGGDNNGPLAGDAGSVSSYELMAFNSEEVGEDEEDVEVAGLEIEVDDGSDLDITAVRLDFAQGSATNDDFDEFVTEVSLWLDGEEVGRVDADGFDEDNDYEKTISLDGAVCRADETCELVVGLTGASNVDSDDEGDTWTVDFEQVRWEDAEGTVISEDPGTGTESFSVETFAASTDVELKASLTDDEDEINDSHVVDVDDTDDTDGIEILAFDLEAEGDSDIDVDSLEVDFTLVGTTADDAAQMATQACLWMGGEELDCQTFDDADNNDIEAIVFDDLDLTISSGDTESFMVSVDVLPTSSDLVNGDTLQATLDVDATEADDESGEELVAGDLTGSAVGEAVGFFDAGLMATFVSSDVDIVNSDTATIPDRGVFTIVFDVTAFDTDIYIDNTAISAEDDGATMQDINVDGGAGTGVVESSADEGVNGNFLVEEGTTERITITIDAAGTDAFASAQLDTILYALTDLDGTTEYSFNMDEYETDSVFLESN